jgi:peroxiredoxin
MSLIVGEVVPKFSLINYNKEVLDSDSLIGRKSLVVFMPYPFTGICDAEACELRDNNTDLESLDAEIVIVTCHARPTNEAWVQSTNLPFPVLSDFWPHGKVSKEYGCFNEEIGVAMRYSYILDDDNKLLGIVNTEELGEARTFEKYMDLLT